MKMRKEWLYFTVLSILSWAGMAQAVTTLTFTPSSLVVTYSPNNTFSLTANLTASQQAPTVFAETSGAVNSCKIESVTRTSNKALITFSTLAATNQVSPFILCKIIVSQPGEGNIDEASGTLNVQILKASQTITPRPLDKFIVGEAQPIYLDSTGTDNPITFVSISTNCQINTSTEPWVIQANSIASSTVCSLAVKKLGDGRYHDLNRTMNITAGKGRTVIDFINPPPLLELPYNQTYDMLVSKTGSTAALTGGTTTGTTCVVSGISGPAPNNTLAVRGTALGKCTVRASAVTDPSYEAASNSIDIQIVKANQVLTITRSPTSSLDVNQTATVTVTSSHPGSTADPAAPILVSVADPTLCSISGTGPYTILALKGGTCQVNASQAGNSLYNAGANSLPIPINKLPQTLTVSGATSFEVSQAIDLTITPGASPSLPKLSVEDISVCRVTVSSRTLARLEGLRGGTCKIRGEQAGDANYQDFPLQNVATITVNKQTLPIQFGSAPVVSVGSSGLLNVTPGPLEIIIFASATPTICNVSTDATSNARIAVGLHVGQCKITATRPETAFQAASGPIEQTFTITQGSQVITPTVPTSLTLGTPVSISANSVSSSGQQLTVSASPSGICSLTPLPPANSNHAQATLTSSTPGDCNITFVQNGTTDYAPSSLTVVSKVIGSQTISFAALDPIAQNGGPLTLVATASSGLPVSFASTTASVCSVAGNQLALLKVGTCGVTASQDGSAYYQAAAPVAQNLTILLPTSTATVTSSINPARLRQALTLTASVGGALPTGNVSFLANGVAIVGCELVALQSGTATCTTSALKPGLHQIVASYSGDANNQGSQSAALAQRVIGLDWLVPVLDLLQN